MLDFPSSPAVDQVFGSPGVRGWKWNGTAWVRTGGKTALERNLIINPAMQISEQNGDTASAAVDYYMADQWLASSIALTGVMSSARVPVATPKGSPYRLRMSVTTAMASLSGGTAVQFAQRMEGFRIAGLGWGTAQGSYSVVQFGFKAPAGTYALNIRTRPTAYRLWASPIVVSSANANTDQYYTYTVAPDPGYAWLSNSEASATIGVTIAAGSTSLIDPVDTWVDNPGGVSKFGVLGQTNGVATVGNVFELFDVGWYSDPYRTGIAPEFQMQHFEDDLRECQRYWYRLYGSRGVVASATIGYVTGNHMVPMRANPAVSVVGAPRAFDLSTAPTITGISHSYSDTTTYYLGPITSGLVVGRPFMHLCDGMSNTTNYIAVSARM